MYVTANPISENKTVTETAVLHLSLPPNAILEILSYPVFPVISQHLIYVLKIS